VGLVLVLVRPIRAPPYQGRNSCATAALAAAKARGVMLGTHGKTLAKQNADAAAARDADLAPVLRELAGQSYQAIAAELD
jgi:alkanesulfonate monooxygenase SsuD/methylene tetrahydromethanopterin reductase-like flavin-dependent oxidoreductase (luciferase family)